MGTFWARALRIMNEKNISQSDIARYLSKPKATVNSWISRDVIPAADIALAIIDFLNEDFRFLITGKLENGITDDEKILIEKYRKLSEQNKSAVHGLTNNLSGIIPIENNNKLKRRKYML